MLENMTTGEKALIGATAIGIAALVFHKPTRNAVGLADRVKSKRGRYNVNISKGKNTEYWGQIYANSKKDAENITREDLDNYVGLQKSKKIKIDAVLNPKGKSNRRYLKGRAYQNRTSHKNLNAMKKNNQ
jgi:hypothetical protein